MAPISTDVFPTAFAYAHLVEEQTLYDVQFYPFTTLDDEQIFAVAGQRDIFVLRPKEDQSTGYEVLRWLKDIVHDHSINSLCWTKASSTNKPLLCIAGNAPKQILVLDVESGSVVQQLSGHGRGTNDLAVSPVSTNLLVSASEDYSLRLWNLQPQYSQQPCVAVFAGEGHRQPIQACSFHSSGQWLLSGGLDTTVCLWAVPSLEELDRFNQDGVAAAHPQPTVVYYPHFFSSEVHPDYIDNVVFYGDLIISRASKGDSTGNQNEILIWKIDGFDSDVEPPAHPPVPKPGQYTRSSFEHAKGSRGFQRLLTLDMPKTSLFYLRFGILHQPDMRPMLAMGDQESTVHFWDLQKIEEGWAPGEVRLGKKPGSRRGRSKSRVRGGKGKAIAGELSSLATQDGSRESSHPSSVMTTTSLGPGDERTYEVADPFKPIKPHKSTVLNTTLVNQDFETRQIAWSPDGTWCVAVGGKGMMTIFHRDKSVVDGVQRPSRTA
ncbi:polycomb protein esc-like [Teratosphaeria destructans]|uniref:Polycomb protein esc-like n=1 Tax=Teratosphaeria destructans TaxID=418781 RepID=A0A9W7SMP1_9PEZI|nr:polycomb protein esc-like [Teratosphaeria destructans]